MSLGPLMIDLRGTTLEPDEREWLESPLVGGVILFTRNFASVEQLAALVADIHAVRQPPLLVTVDHEGGRVQRFREPFFRLPPLRALGRLYDEDRELALRTAGACGWLMAAELRAVGVDLSFTPCVDLDLGLADVIGDRALHREAAAVAALARRFAAGAKKAGMAITAKHFPTHAGAHSDSHTEFAVDNRELADLDDDLKPYRDLIRNGLPRHHGRARELSGRRRAAREPVELVDQSLLARRARVQGRRDLRRLEHGRSRRRRLRRDARAARARGRLRSRAALQRAGAGAPVLESLHGYVNPTAQLRLTRLHGGGELAWEGLHASAEWQKASALVAPLRARPKLKLEG